MHKIILFLLLFGLSANCLKATEPDTAFNNQFRRDIGGWIAADATYSIYLPDGRTLWLFGDTFIGKVNGISIVPGAKFIRNSAVIQDGNELQTLHGGTPQVPDDFIKTTTPENTWYWPEHGIVDTDTLRILVAKFKKANNGTPGFNFEHDGNDIASFTWPGLEFIRTDVLEPHHINGVIYGDRILADTSYLYIYGRKSDPDNFNIPYPHVARTTEGHLMEQYTWEYFDGAGWSTDPSASKPFQDIPVSQQYCVTNYYGIYILLTQNIWLSPEIFSYVSNSPTGPWKNKTKLYKTPETSGKTWTYNAYAHPQFNKKNELLVSYNVNGEFSSIFSDVELYRPRFIRVPYRNISYDFWETGNSKEEIRDLQVGLFPNPLSDLSQLKVNIPVAGNFEWEILDLLGRQVTAGISGYVTEGFYDPRIQSVQIKDGMYFFRGSVNNIPFTLPLYLTNKQ